MARRGVVNNLESKEREVRPFRPRRYKFFFLIVCEDEKTEPYYFDTFLKKFPEETVFLRTVGTGRSSLGVVQKAIIERDNLQEEIRKEIDEVWAVFDKDDAQNSVGNTFRFSEAFRLSRENEIRVAYSNEVFELWLLLHFIDVNSSIPIPRNQIYVEIETAIKLFPNHLNFIYEHGKTTVIDIMIELGNEDYAIERAERISVEQEEKLPIDKNPSTTVHILVKKLRELIEWYSYTPN